MGDAAAREKMSVERAIGPDRGLVMFQLVLLVVALLGAPVQTLLAGRGFTLISGWFNILVGFVVIWVGLQISGSARSALAESFTMSPTPVADGRLIENGIYGRLRHPMYLSLIIILTGWAVAWGSVFGLLSSAVVAIFLSLKSRREERLLESRYPVYRNYRARVPGGIIPLPRKRSEEEEGAGR